MINEDKCQYLWQPYMAYTPTIMFHRRGGALDIGQSVSKIVEYRATSIKKNMSSTQDLWRSLYGGDGEEIFEGVWDL